MKPRKDPENTQKQQTEKTQTHKTKAKTKTQEKTLNSEHTPEDR